MPTVEDILANSPRHEVDQYIPESVDQILQVITREPLSAKKRVEMALSITPPEKLLRNRDHRNQLFNRLDQEEAEELAEKLELGTDGNVYANLKSTQFTRGSDREVALFNFFETDIPDTNDENENPGLTTIQPKYGLFDYQLEIFEDILRYLDSDTNRVFLHMPTGSGKTRITMSVVCHIIKETDSGTVLWLAEGKELLEQAGEEFSEAWEHLGNQEVQISRFYGSHEWDSIEQGVIIAGLRKLWNKEKDSIDFLPSFSPDVSLVVFDEAHHSVANTYQKIIKRLTLYNPDCRLLGLSATPGRTYANREADRELSRLYNRNKVAIDIPGYDDPFDYLIAKGYLSTPTFHTLNIKENILTKKLQKEVEGMSRGQEYSKKILQKLSEDDRRNIKIIRKIEDLIDEGHTRIILFATTVQHAEIISAALNGLNVESAVISAETPDYVRTREISRFRSKTNEPRVLCNYNVLTTGFDAPRTSAAVIARPTTSLVLYSQMVGRAIRGPEVGGTEEADIWTVIDTDLPGFGDLPEAFWNWEDIW